MTDERHPQPEFVRFIGGHKNLATLAINVNGKQVFYSVDLKTVLSAVESGATVARRMTISGVP